MITVAKKNQNDAASKVIKWWNSVIILVETQQNFFSKLFNKLTIFYSNLKVFIYESGHLRLLNISGKRKINFFLYWLPKTKKFTKPMGQCLDSFTDIALMPAYLKFFFRRQEIYRIFKTETCSYRKKFYNFTVKLFFFQPSVELNSYIPKKLPTINTKIYREEEANWCNQT